MVRKEECEEDGNERKNKDIEKWKEKKKLVTKERVCECMLEVAHKMWGKRKEKTLPQ